MIGALAVLLAFQLARNWHGQINLITVVHDEAEKNNGEHFMSQLIEYGRMPKNTNAIVAVDTFASYLPHAPQADLNIFGLQERVDIDFARQMIVATDSSCVFVRDSGNESALA